jgi:hypothetical protein
VEVSPKRRNVDEALKKKPNEKKGNQKKKKQSE